MVTAVSRKEIVEMLKEDYEGMSDEVADKTLEIFYGVEDPDVKEREIIRGTAAGIRRRIENGWYGDSVEKSGESGGE